MKKCCHLCLVVIAQLALVSCSDTTDVEGGGGSLDSFKSVVTNIDLTDDVWDGHAVCYGGFRAGQAPGARYPSDAEILEDMLILEKNWNQINPQTSVMKSWSKIKSR